MTAKYAQTLDGRIATSSGHSRWISGEASRALAHRLRAEHDAVLVGVGTVIADDPSLTVRLAPGENPLRVVVDSTLRTPLTSALLRAAPETTLLATTTSAPPEREARIIDLGARVVRLPACDGRVDLGALLQDLAKMRVRSVLVEGGAGIITAFLRLRLIDRLVIFIAPKVIGTGVEAIGDLEIRSVDNALSFEEHSVERVGQDLVFTGRVVWPSA